MGVALSLLSECISERNKGETATATRLIVSEENRRMDFGRRMSFLCRTYLCTFMVFYLLVCTEGSYSKTCEKNCVFGRCINGTCICEKGWAGDLCQHCQGRFK
ncbi:hypothetical protein QQF64_005849 [Cirrhinus molitorella]